tara:strand:- start:1557 stop:2195 length:639 start_codon:yes stop_codon:yes gene_type:complete
MKKIFIIIFLFQIFISNSYSQDNFERTVIEGNYDISWKVNDKYIIPECFDYVWYSGDRYETYFDEYIEKLESSHWDDSRFKIFIVEIGKYLNNEVPLNHSIKDGWEEYPDGISLTKKLNSCMSDQPETKVMVEDKYGKSEIRYEVLESYDNKKGKEFAPHIKQDFESVKKVKITWWDGGSMGHQNQTVTYGLLKVSGERVLLPLINHIKFSQ